MSTVRSHRGLAARVTKKTAIEVLKLIATCQILSALKEAFFFLFASTVTKEARIK